MNAAGIPPGVICHHRRWDLPWEVQMFDRLTIWYPPLEIAAQLLYFLLQCHEEKPLTTSALIVLPHVMQKRWSRPSCHVIEIGTYQRAMLVPFAQHSLLTIPIVLLLIPCHVCTYPDISLDSAPATALPIQHRQQAAIVRRVLDAIEQP
jgi:hypothetical protein